MKVDINEKYISIFADKYIYLNTSDNILLFRLIYFYFFLST